MSQDKDLQAFRLAFCKEAASKGLTPSELIKEYKASYKQAAHYKQAAIPNPLTAVDWKALATDSALLSLLLGTGAGVVGGLGVAALKNSIDPNNEIDSAYTAVEELKNDHLLAKYKSGIRRLGLKS